MEVVPSLQAVWQGIPVRTADPTSAFDAPSYANRTLHADVPFAREIRELMAADPLGRRAPLRARIRRVVDYSAKLGRHRDVDDDVDLFTVLPTSRARSVPTVRAGLAAGIDRELKDECEREAKTRQRLEGCIPHAE